MNFSDFHVFILISACFSKIFDSHFGRYWELYLREHDRRVFTISVRIPLWYVNAPYILTWRTRLVVISYPHLMQNTTLKIFGDYFAMYSHSLGSFWMKPLSFQNKWGDTGWLVGFRSRLLRSMKANWCPFRTYFMFSPANVFFISTSAEVPVLHDLLKILFIFFNSPLP